MLLFVLQPIVGVILIYPLWEICRKLGRNPVLSLIAVVPIVGLMALALILAFGRWPSVDGMALKNPATP
jgi:hypothetical protein